MSKLVVTHPPGLDQERCYAFKVIFDDWLGLDYRAETAERTDIQITAADDAENRALHLPDWFFSKAATDWLKSDSLPADRMATWLPNGLGGGLIEPLPVMFGPDDAATSSRSSIKKSRIDLPIDVFGSIFFMLSRYEEAVSTVRDNHDRFPASASFNHRHGLLERPLANEYLEVFWNALQRLWPSLRRRSRHYNVVPSHDIDVPFAVRGRSWQRVGKSMAADLVHRRSPGLAVRRLASRLTRGETSAKFDPNNSFSFILKASERHHLKSTFFFKAGASDPLYDEDYRLETAPMASILKEIHGRGHELGLHPSYHTYNHPKRLKSEFDTLLQAADRLDLHQDQWGGRQHYLRFAAPKTWRHYAEVGLDYDATLALADHPGFRCGTCYDFPVYDLERRETLSLREKPLTVMEGTMLDPDYLGLSPSAARKRIIRLAQACRQFGGSFNLLWHNSRLITETERRLYSSILEAIAP